MARMRGRKRKKSIYGLQLGWIFAAVVSILVIIVCGEKLIALSNNFKSDDSSQNSNKVIVDNKEQETLNKPEKTDPKTPTGTDNTPETKTPTGEANTPKNESTSPTDITPKPTDITPEPTDITPKPTDITPEPTDITPEPTDITPKPTDITPEPTDITPKPTDKPSKSEKEDNKKLVAFTFDDGPYPPVTKRILDVLQENGAKATFFVMGNRMGTYPDTVKSAYEIGCEIGNHSYSHENLTKLDTDKIIYEVEHSDDCIKEVISVGNVLLRPPYGEHNELVDKTVKVPMIAWSVDSEDWKSRNKDSIVKEVLDHVQDGSIVLMHDLYSTTADAVEYLVPELIKQGYELVTVSELFERKGIEIEAGKLYRNAKSK